MFRALWHVAAALRAVRELAEEIIYVARW